MIFDVSQTLMFSAKKIISGVAIILQLMSLKYRRSAISGKGCSDENHFCPIVLPRPNLTGPEVISEHQHRATASWHKPALGVAGWRPPSRAVRAGSSLSGSSSRHRQRSARYDRLTHGFSSATPKFSNLFRRTSVNFRSGNLIIILMS